MGFHKASQLSKDGTVYASENLREAIELCNKQSKMIQEMKKELDSLREDITEDE